VLLPGQQVYLVVVEGEVGRRVKGRHHDAADPGQPLTDLPRLGAVGLLELLGQFVPGTKGCNAAGDLTAGDGGLQANFVYSTIGVVDGPRQALCDLHVDVISEAVDDAVLRGESHLHPSALVQYGFAV
jgi:hypothetical protein